MLHPQIENKFREAEQALGVYEQQYKKYQQRQQSKMFVNLFWLVLLAVIVIGIGVLGYTNREVALSFIQEKAAALLNVPNPNTSPVTQTDCKDISVSTSENGKPEISPVTLGNCYLIGEEHRSFWKETFSSNEQVSAFSAYIYDNSSNKILNQDEIAEAVRKSLSENVLDLRKTQEVPTPTAAPPTATSLPSATPTPEFTATPVPTATPAVIVVPFPEKERHLDLVSLIATMKSHNILSVASNNNASDFRDKVNWQVWYETGNGKDYLIFNTLNSNLPDNCSKATFISFSIQNTGSEGETAMTVEGTQVWFICK